MAQRPPSAPVIRVRHPRPSYASAASGSARARRRARAGRRSRHPVRLLPLTSTPAADGTPRSRRQTSF